MARKKRTRGVNNKTHYDGTRKDGPKGQSPKWRERRIYASTRDSLWWPLEIIKLCTIVRNKLDTGHTGGGRIGEDLNLWLS
jgi:hypothetical protein